MKKKNLLILSTLLLGLTIASCGPTSNNESTSDSNTLPTENTSTSKEDTQTSIDPSQSEVTSTAPSISDDPILDPSTNPILSEDKKTITYGMYPQSYVSDESLIFSLNELSSGQTGWYYFNDQHYVSIKASIYNGCSYVFNDGTSIINEEIYWFSCEPIVWNVLDVKDDTYFVVSSLLLDVSMYYSDFEQRVIEEKVVESNSYEHSDIRKFLINDFYNCAFDLNSYYLNETNINGLYDKVYLSSYEDYLNSDYGFDSNNGLSSSRICKTTDYARAKGAWYSEENSYLYNGTYWTRTPSNKYSYCAYNVNSGGYISEYAVNGSSHCVRPAITVTMRK